MSLSIQNLEVGGVESRVADDGGIVRDVGFSGLPCSSPLVFPSASTHSLGPTGLFRSRTFESEPATAAGSAWPHRHNVADTGYVSFLTFNCRWLREFSREIETME